MYPNCEFTQSDETFGSFQAIERPVKAWDVRVWLRWFAQHHNGMRMHPTNQTLDDNVSGVATLEENWGVDLWPA
eukprot:1086467-Pleurochrysis_carterae.AAC.1